VLVAGQVVQVVVGPEADSLADDTRTLEPAPDAGVVTVVAPVAGNLMKVHPHAFVVLRGRGRGAGAPGIDTVHLGGEGFTLHRAEGDDVAACAPVVSFDVALVRRKGLSAVCPVVVLDSPAGAVSAPTGHSTEVGAALFTCSTGG
jgi:phosphotransferase system IIA component